MNADTLLHQLGKVNRAHTAAPGADYVAVQSGKLRYLGRGLFVEIDTKLPDLELKLADVPSIVSWLTELDVDAAVSVESRDKTVVFSTRLDDYSTIVLSLNKPTHDFPFGNAYVDVDEIVLNPLLTHDYKFTLSAKKLAQAKQAFKAAGRHEDSRHPTITMTVNGSVVTFSVNSLNGASKVVFRGGDDAELPDSWEGSYTLESFLYGTYGYVYDDQQDVKFTFKDNEKKELSQLLIEYEEGIKVVLSPVWN